MDDHEQGFSKKDAPVQKTFWFRCFSWPVLGTLAAILLSFGGCFMTSAHPYVSDSFCLVGLFILLIKFWTWEEAKGDTPRKTALLLAGGTLILLGTGIGLCLLSAYAGQPTQIATSAKNTPVLSSPPIKEDAPNEQPTQIQTHIHKSSSAKANNKSLPKTDDQRAGEKEPTYQQQCVGSACAQGPNSSATYNQFGTPKLAMTPKQQAEISKAMKGFAGITVTVQANPPTKDTVEFGKMLEGALKGAGLITTGIYNSRMMFANTVDFPGMSIDFGNDRSNVANALAKVMIHEGLIKAPIDRGPDTDSGLFVITIAPN